MGGLKQSSDAAAASPAAATPTSNSMDSTHRDACLDMVDLAHLSESAFLAKILSESEGKITQPYLLLAEAKTRGREVRRVKAFKAIQKFHKSTRRLVREDPAATPLASPAVGLLSAGLLLCAFVFGKVLCRRHRR